jgi:hypothetical protein
MATILRAYNENNEKYDLDVFNEEAFLLDISAIESGDIGKVFGITSQTFALPSTNINDTYFGNLYDIGATPATSFIKTLPCQVLDDGQEIFSGNIYLENVITDNNGDTIYNVVVVNETIDFKYQIEDLTFGDLDWTEYNHNLTYNNITASWDNNLFNGEVVYPLIEYGAEQNDVNSTLIQNGGQVNTFTNNNYPLIPADFQPAIRLRTMIDKIFDTTNYTYTSSFFDDAYFDSVYMISTQDATRGGAFISPVSQSFKAYNDAPQSYSGASTFVWQEVDFNTEIYDNAGAWDTAGSTFRAVNNGDYSFNVNLPFTISGITQVDIATLVVGLYKNGSLIQSTQRLQKYNTNPASSPLFGNFTTQWVNVPLTTADVLEVRIQYNTNDSASTLELNSGTQTYFSCYQSPQAIRGGNVNLGGLFNDKDKVIDFLNGVIQKFNLVIEPLPETPTIINIETFNDWRDAGSIVDWSDKVDKSIKYEIRHPLASNPKNIYFSDEEDKDYFNEYSQDVLATTFGSTTYESEADLAIGVKEIGSYFAPTPMRYIQGDTTFIVPQIYSAKGENQEQLRMVYKPRLLHYLGKKTNNNLIRTGASGEWYFQDDSDVVQAQTQHPVFHHVNALPTTTASLDLHFNNPQHADYHQQFVNSETENDAFHVYWAEYVNELYDIDARLITLNVKLSPSDIPDIRLNDKIHIDGHYYRINKIMGANLTNEQSTKVELLKTPTQKLKYPRRRIAVGDFGGNDYVDARVSNDGLDLDTGRVDYVDFETGLPLTDGTIISQASSRDGFRYFSGSNEVVWKPNRTNIPTRNVSNGINYIDERATNVNIQGNGNYVSGLAVDTTIVGNNNNLIETEGNIQIFGDNVSASGSVNNLFIVNQSGNLSIESGSQNIVALQPTEAITEFDNNEVIVGNLWRQGLQYESYLDLEMSASMEYYMTGSNLTNFHTHIRWAGVNGTSTIYIPSGSIAEDRLQLRFTSDGTLGASKVVNITPLGGTTIDGNAEEPLTTPYDGMTAQLLNNEWQVIQRKK